MKEYELIPHLFGGVKDLFRSDAQIVEVGGQKWGMTCDNFSLEEDLFSDEDPFRLGSNLVVATLSDLCASACKAAFYEHAVTFAKNADIRWAEELAAGIAHALAVAECKLAGGDTGCAERFSYTGIALGPQMENVSRILPPRTQNIYVSGRLGDANEAALLGTPTPEFEWRGIPQNMLACMDTSGGFMDALWQLHTLNPNFRLEVSGVPTADIRFLFGGAGEYELLYTSGREMENAIHIGKAVFGETGVYLEGVEITSPPPDPRSYGNLKEYIADINGIVQKLFK